jgi:hypothetical protein
VHGQTLMINHISAIIESGHKVCVMEEGMREPNWVGV